MKKYFSFIIFALAVLMVMAGCEKEENKVYFEGGTAPVLTASATTVPLTFATQDQQALKLSWTNPNYQFTTGVSSQNVTYQIEIDTVGANFTNPKRVTIAVSNDLERTFTQTQFNDFLLNQMELSASKTHNLQIRVRASLGTDAVPLYSNIVAVSARPFTIPPKVTPPASGKLFITGGATPASWMGGGDAEVPSQKFTQVSPTLYVLQSIRLTGGESFLFVPQYGDWSKKYGYDGSNNGNNVNGDAFKAEGGDMKAPAETGNYKIEVNFQTGRFRVTKL